MKTKKGLLVLILLALTFVLGFALTACGEEEPPAPAPTPTSFTVTFNTDGGSAVSAQTIPLDGKVVEPNSPTKDGYTFGGWYKEAECTNVWAFGTDTVKGDITLYAKWTENVVAKYTVTFNSNGGSDVTSLTDVAEGSLISKPIDPTKDHYKFGDWCTDEALTLTWRFASDKVTENITLYASWVAEEYTVKFDTQGGSGVTDVKANYNTTISEQSSTTRTGYTLDGWYTEAGYTTKWDFEENKVTENITLYAKWTPEEYTITFDTRSGDPASFTETGTYGELLAEPTTEFTKEHYIFDKWCTDLGLTTPWTFGSDTVTGAMTLYAKWTPKDYTITFDTGKDAITETFTKDVPYDTLITKPEDPEKTGFTLVGWYTDPNFSAESIWNFSNRKVEGAITLYANWTVAKYTVTFNTNGGEVIPSQEIEYNKAINWMTPKKDNNKFAGWYKDADCSDGQEWKEFVDTVTKDTILYAKWEGAFGYTLSADKESYILTSFNESLYTSDTITVEGTYNEKPVTAISGGSRNVLFSNVNKPIILPDSIVEIGTNSFAYITQPITLSKNITKIGDEAFSFMRLDSFTLPGSVREIGKNIFDGAIIGTLTLGEGITELFTGILGRSQIDTLVLPSTLTTIKAKIGNDVIYSYPLIWIPKTVTTIEAGAIDTTANFPQIFTEYAENEIPATWEAGWNNGTPLTYGIASQPTFIDGAVYQVEDTYAVLTHYFSAHERKVLRMPNNVTISGDSYPVKTIKSGAFSKLELKFVLFVNSGLETIESGAFTYTSNDSNLYLWIPDSVTTFASSNVTIKYIATNATSRPAGWDSYWDEINYSAPEPLIIDNEFLVGMDKGNVTLLQYFGEIELNKIAPSTVNFNGAKNITHVDIPNDGNTYFMTLVLPDNCTTIISSLQIYTWAYLPKSVISIPDKLFADDDSSILLLESSQAEIAELNWTEGALNASLVHYGSKPETVNGLTYFVLNNNASLLSIDMNATEISIDATVSIGGQDYAFDGVYPADVMYGSKAEKLTIGEGIEEIPDSLAMHANKITSIKLPSTLKTIGKSAFTSISELQSIIIPAGVTMIDEGAFSRCEKLTIYLESGEHLSNFFNTLNPSDPQLWNGSSPYYVKSDNPETDTLPSGASGFWHYAEDGVTPVSY